LGWASSHIPFSQKLHNWEKYISYFVPTSKYVFLSYINMLCERIAQLQLSIAYLEVSSEVFGVQGPTYCLCSKKGKRKKKKIIISSSLNSLFNFAFELSRDSSFVAVIFLCHQKLLFSWWCNFNHYCQYVYWFLSTFFIDCFGSALYFLCNKQNIDYEENAGIKFVSLLVMIRLSFHFFLLYVHFYLIFISLIYNL